MPTRAKKPKPVRGLAFHVQITPLRNGQPWPGVEPIIMTFDNDVPQWHEQHVDTGFAAAIREVEQRVRKVLAPRARGRR